MSGTSGTKTPRIDLRLSRESIADVKTFRAELEKTQQRASELKQDLKQTTEVLKALKAREIQIGKGGTGAFVEGSRFRDARRVAETQRLATSTAQMIELNKTLLGLSRQGLKFSQDKLKVQDALNLNLRTQARTLNRLNDLAQVQNKLESARIRLGLEAANGNTSAERSARRIVTVLEKRVELLKQETKERAQAAREAKKLTDAQAGARARKMSMERLFGDGGASLFAVQSGLMANYAALSAAQSGAVSTFSFTADLDESLRNLQAITRTTDTGMQDLRESLIGVSEATKFTAVEVSNAAVTLGQAGLSVEQIEDAVAAVSLLATATGTDLDRAVDIATSTLGVFNMESSRMGDVANVMTEAVNSSKLNIEKLTLGLQYSGNIAAQSGIQFEELTAAMGAMANAGIRSGSTLGTGMRQILIALQKPSGEFKNTLHRLGLSMEDVNIRTKGLYGVLNNLEKAGFTAGDAIRSFEVRAAAAFNALSTNKDQMLDLETAFRGTTASIKANETQMRSFRNQGKRLGSVLGSVMSIGFEPMILLLRDMAKMLGDVGERLRAYPNMLRVVVTSVATLVAAWGAFRIASLVTGLIALAGGLRWVGASAAIAAVGTRAFWIALGPIGAAVGVAALAFSAFSRETALANTTMDTQAATLERATGVAEKYSDQIAVVNGKIAELRERSDTLTSGSVQLQAEIENVRSQFVGMGYDVTSTASTVNGLITNLGNLRRALSRKFIISLGIEGTSIAGLINIVKINASTAQTNFTNRDTTSVPMTGGPPKIITPVADVASALLGAADYASTTTGLNNDPVELKSYQVKVLEQIAILNNNIANGTATSADAGKVTHLTTYNDFLNKQIEFASQLQSLDKSRLSNANDQRIASQQADPIYQVTDDKIAALEKQYRQAREDALRIPRGQPHLRDTRFGALTGGMDQSLDTLESGMQGLLSNGTQSEESLAPLLKRMAELRGEMERTGSELFDDGAPLR